MKLDALELNRASCQIS